MTTPRRRRARPGMLLGMVAAVTLALLAGACSGNDVVGLAPTTTAASGVAGTPVRARHPRAPDAGPGRPRPCSEWVPKAEQIQARVRRAGHGHRHRLRRPGRLRRRLRHPSDRQRRAGRRQHRLPAGVAVQARRRHGHGRPRRTGRHRLGRPDPRPRLHLPALRPVGHRPRHLRRPLRPPQRAARPRRRLARGPRLRPGPDPAAAPVRARSSRSGPTTTTPTSV